MVTAGEIGRTRSKPTPVGVRVGILTQVSCSKSFGVPFPFHRAWGAPYPRFPEKFSGSREPRAPFLKEKRTRYFVRRRVQEIRGISLVFREMWHTTKP